MVWFWDWVIYIYNYIIMTNHQSNDYRQQRGSHRIFDILEEKSHSISSCHVLRAQQERHALPVVKDNQIYIHIAIKISLQNDNDIKFLPTHRFLGLGEFRICLCCFFHACPCCLFCACELHIWVRTVSELHSTEFHPETFRHYGTANFHTTTYCWCAIFIMIHNISVIWSEGAFRYTGTRMNLIDSTELLGWRICSWPECFLREWDSKVYSTLPIVKIQA